MQSEKTTTPKASHSAITLRGAICARDLEFKFRTISWYSSTVFQRNQIDSDLEIISLTIYSIGWNLCIVHPMLLSIFILWYLILNHQYSNFKSLKYFSFRIHQQSFQKSTGIRFVWVYSFRQCPCKLYFVKQR